MKWLMLLIVFGAANTYQIWSAAKLTETNPYLIPGLFVAGTLLLVLNFVREWQSNGWLIVFLGLVGILGFAMPWCILFDPRVSCILKASCSKTTTGALYWYTFNSVLIFSFLAGWIARVAISKRGKSN